MQLAAVTVTLNDATCRAMRADSRGAASCVAQRIREAGWTTPAVLVVEKSPDAKPVKTAVDLYKTRLHIHMLTLVPSHPEFDIEDQKDQLKSLLKKYATKAKNSVELTTTYKTTRLYTEFDELEEELHGAMPCGEKEVAGEHWQNTWKTHDKHGVWHVHTRLPVNQGWPDYLSKALDDQIENDSKAKKATRNFALMNSLEQEVSEYKKLKHAQGRLLKEVGLDELSRRAKARIKYAEAKKEIRDVKCSHEHSGVGVRALIRAGGQIRKLFQFLFG